MKLVDLTGHEQTDCRFRRSYHGPTLVARGRPHAVEAEHGHAWPSFNQHPDPDGDHR